MQERRTRSRVSKQWVKETRECFLDFPRATNCPAFAHWGECRLEVEYPEWLTLRIGVATVICKEKTYVGIHRLSTR